MCCFMPTTKPRGTTKCCANPAERIARATVHLQKTLNAGFAATIRDLGTEGAAFDDVGLKQKASKKGVIQDHA